MIFKKAQNNKLVEIKSQEFRLEKDIQKLVEGNLDVIFGLKFLATEFAIQDMRFDTVAYDEESKAFVIIEFKKVKNNSLVDQGYSYLNMMLDRKSNFVLLYNKVTCTSKQEEDFNWSMTRLFFISPSFSRNQLNAVGTNMPFRLFEIRQYAGDLFEITEKRSNLKSMVPLLDSGSSVSTVNKVVKVWNFDDYVIRSKPREEVIELYNSLVDSVSNIADFDVDYKKVYIAFKVNRENIFDCAFMKTRLKIWINLKWGELDELPKDLLCKDVSNVGHHGNGEYQFEVSSESELELLIPLIRKALMKKTG